MNSYRKDLGESETTQQEKVFFKPQGMKKYQHQKQKASDTLIKHNHITVACVAPVSGLVNVMNSNNYHFFQITSSLMNLMK